MKKQKGKREYTSAVIDFASNKQRIIKNYGNKRNYWENMRSEKPEKEEFSFKTDRERETL